MMNLWCRLPSLSLSDLLPVQSSVLPTCSPPTSEIVTLFPCRLMCRPGRRREKDHGGVVCNTPLQKQKLPPSNPYFILDHGRQHLHHPSPTLTIHSTSDGQRTSPPPPPLQPPWRPLRQLHLPLTFHAKACAPISNIRSLL